MLDQDYILTRAGDWMLSTTMVMHFVHSLPCLCACLFCVPRSWGNLNISLNQPCRQWNVLFLLRYLFPCNQIAEECASKLRDGREGQRSESSSSWQTLIRFSYEIQGHGGTGWGWGRRGGWAFMPWAFLVQVHGVTFLGSSCGQSKICFGKFGMTAFLDN